MVNKAAAPYGTGDNQWTHLGLTGQCVWDTPDRNCPALALLGIQEGYFETRIRYQNDPWVWPAFWLWSAEDTQTWPDQAAEMCDNPPPLNRVPEWDIMENSYQRTNSFLHYNTGGMCAAADEIRAAVQQNADGSDWHVWGGYWTDTEVCLYMDGVSLGCAATFDSTAQPMHLALTLARQPEGFVAQECTRLGLDPCPPPTPELWMEVDYVRIWQQTEPPPPPPADVEGDVDFHLWAKSAADYFTSNPTQAQKDFMNAHYDRALVFSPYWDSRLSWYPRGNEYIDAMAVKPEWLTAPRSDPDPASLDWVFRDAAGNPVYIDFGCSPTCPQYAADVSNPAFQAWWLDWVSEKVALGYPGIFMDDVNMRITGTFSDANGNSIAPIDPDTGAPLTLAKWQDDFADFLELVRTTYPSLEIVHNTVWYVDQTTFTNPEVSRQIAAADLVMLEHGGADPGLDCCGSFGYRTLLTQIDRIHALGRNVIVNGEQTGLTNQEQNLATYLLINDGGDMVGSEQYGTASSHANSVFPDDASFWPGFRLQLGAAAGARYDWVSGGQTFIRRDFTGGFVVTREPGLSSASFPVPAGYHRIDGTTPSTITLAGRQSVVLIADTPAPTTTTTTTAPPPTTTTTTTTTTAPPPTTTTTTTTVPPTTTTTKPCKPRPGRPCPP